MQNKKKIIKTYFCYYDIKEAPPVGVRTRDLCIQMQRSLFGYFMPGPYNISLMKTCTGKVPKIFSLVFTHLIQYFTI